MSRYIIGATIIFAFYAIIPTLIIRLFGYRSIHQGPTHKDAGIALTFDDGPDPIYTAELLDLLKEHNVKATFFVLGKKAELYPDLIRRIHVEGHQIGIHNYVHFANPFMAPWKVRKQIRDTADLVEQITGTRPVYYRPPWGVFNIFDMFLPRTMKFVMWTIMSEDWRTRGGEDKISQRMLSNLHRGSILLLHDSGDTFGAEPDAPKYMLRALRSFLEHTQAQGYKYVRVDDMLRDLEKHEAKLKISKKMLIKVWFGWEKIWHTLFQFKAVDKGNSIFHYRVTTYSGEPIYLDDGGHIRQGDKVVEIHFDNHMLYDIALHSRSNLHLAVQMLNKIQSGLPELMNLIYNDIECRYVKGLYGITLIHRGSKNLGFNAFDMPKGLFASITKRYLRMLMYVLHPDGKERLKIRRDMLVPKIVVMSSDFYKKKYPMPHDALNLQQPGTLNYSPPLSLD
ncbi:polysaccharide deacetylase family protein [Paenibacillus sp. N1-5-1-14]|uniref:polysaccharide deacetylase family protein n=1 Tax=Paenibacillus radicibacter TaxID=2972488 RepID=UPI0021595AB4|nr:polysaccharide deacetylase family protein [Paenibacillus radicibacter]MCR8641250.1 polysaccharide deacetylase family protein [Paenibacillus radicibacter]